jgi:hypothetical protein
MAYQEYDNSQHYQGYSYSQGNPTSSYESRIREYDATHVPPHYAADYDPYHGSSSDYIGRPRFSKSDYIAPPGQSSRHFRPTYDDDATYYSTSDYISPPVDSRDDYISPNYETTHQHSFPEAYDDGAGEQDAYDAFYEEERSPLRSVNYAAPIEEKSNYQLMIDAGFTSKHEFMRAHGLKTWEPDDYEAANEILNGYREVDAQNSRPQLHPLRRELPSQDDSLAYDSDLDTYVNDSDEGQQHVYASDSDIPSPNRYSSRSPVESSSPDPRPRPSRRYRSTTPPPPYNDRNSTRDRYLSSSPTTPRYSPRSPTAPRYNSAPDDASDFEIHGGSDSDCTYMRRRSSSRSRHYNSSSPALHDNSDFEYAPSRSPVARRSVSFSPAVYAGSEVGSGYVSRGGSEDYVGSDVCSDLCSRPGSDDGLGSDDGWSGSED